MSDATTIFNSTTAELDTQLTTQNTRSTTAINDASQFLTALTNAALYGSFTIDPLTPENIFITSPLLTSVAPDRPTTKIDAIKASIPTEPADFTATAPDRAIQSAPQESFVAPTISFPTAPTFTEEVKPSKQTTSLPNAVTKPTPSIPSDLTVSSQTVPNIPSISLPSFGETIPTLDISLPPTTLAYVESTYTSSIKTAIETSLLSKIQNGGTGLNATIEGNIWNRDVERLAEVLEDNITDTMNRFSGRGFTAPPGVLAAQVQELQINHTNERAQQSRDVAIEQAKIADQNTRAFLESGLSWENVQISHANNIANRSLEAEKSVIEFGISLFNSKVTKFNAEIARYQAKDLEVQSEIRIQQLGLEQYKAELSGVEASSNKDRVSIENYRAKIAGHDAIVNLYQAETAATNTALAIERAKIEIFKTDIDDYVARIGAKKNEYDLYLAEVQGEKAKIDLNQSQVAAYSARVNAVKVSNDVVIQQLRTDIETQELDLRAHVANVDVWKEKAKLAVTELGLESGFYNADIGKYREDVRKEIAQAELNIQTLVKGAQLEQANADIQLQTAIANNNTLIEQAKTKIAAAKGASDGYVALATVAAGVIQTMLQLGSTGTSTVTEST
jgi:hypothetical protein